MSALKATTRQTPLGASSYAVHSFGSGEPTLLALHGFTGSGLDFSALASGLGAALHCPDLSGHGGTVVAPAAGRVDGAGGACAGIEACADDVAGLAAELGLDRPVLLGYSMGGRTALTLACRRPAFARGLVLIGASPGLDDAVERAARRASDEVLASTLEAEGTAAFMDRWEDVPLLRSQRRMHPASWKEFCARRRAGDAHGLALSLRTMGTGSMPPLWDRLADLELPTLLVTGEEDVRYTEIARAMAARLPRAECRVVAAAGHSPHLERPPEVAEVVRAFVRAL